jgi:signal peptidase I
MAKRSASDSPSNPDKSESVATETAIEGSVSSAASKDKKGKKADPPKSHDGGWRETIESLAMAVILALLFKGYVAEAFVIPTGSMAPTLQGRHKDVSCPQCGYGYQTTASDEVDRQGFLTGQHVISGTCPICRFTQTFDPIERPNDGSFSGDRIIVSKFAYEIAEPKRWDVIVFKYPEEATQNYIKRLVGLPGEHLMITGGNVYVRDAKAPEESAGIARKPPHKLTAMLQVVDDSDHIPESLTKIGWPARWREPAAASGQTSWKTEDGGKSFSCDAPPSQLAWLRYRHLVPTYADWESITLDKKLPADVPSRRGQLITDVYAYNTSVPIYVPDDSAPRSKQYYRIVQGNHDIDVEDLPERFRSTQYGVVRYDPSLAGPGIPCRDSHLGNHWVDDLACECLAEIQDRQGTVAVELVRAGVRYQCSIDIATGKATLNRINAAGMELPFADAEFAQVWQPTADTIVKEPGFYRLRLTNCDHQVMLFVNGRAVTFDKPTFYDSDDVVVPQWNAQDGLDLEPARVGVSGTRAKLSHLRIYRDKYYIAIDSQGPITDYLNEYQFGGEPSNRPSLQQLFASPDLWSSSGLFDPKVRREVHFEMTPDQYFPMGDNSPGSYDGRYWPSANYVDRDLLIGKALLIYWPHSWNRPPLLPNFQRMGRIR